MTDHFPSRQMSGSILKIAKAIFVTPAETDKHLKLISWKCFSRNRKRKKIVIQEYGILEIQ